MSTAKRILIPLLFCLGYITPYYAMMEHGTDSSHMRSIEPPNSTNFAFQYILEYPSHDYRTFRPSISRSPGYIKLALQNNTELCLNYIAQTAQRILECFIHLKSCMNLYEVRLGPVQIKQYLKTDLASSKYPCIPMYELELLGVVKPNSDTALAPCLEQVVKNSCMSVQQKYNEILEKIKKVPSKIYFVESLFLLYIIVRYLRRQNSLKSLNFDSLIKYLDLNTKLSKCFIALLGLDTTLLTALKPVSASILTIMHFKGIELLTYTLESTLVVLHGPLLHCYILSFLIYFHLITKYKSILQSKGVYQNYYNKVLNFIMAFLTAQDGSIKPNIHQQSTELESSQSATPIEQYDLPKTFFKVINLSQKDKYCRNYIQLIIAAIHDRCEVFPKWFGSTKLSIFNNPTDYVGEMTHEDFTPNEEFTFQEIYLDVDRFRNPRVK